MADKEVEKALRRAGVEESTREYSMVLGWTNETSDSEPGGQKEDLVLNRLDELLI